jgi:hypothetical protein
MNNNNGITCDAGSLLQEASRAAFQGRGLKALSHRLIKVNYHHFISMDA